MVRPLAGRMVTLSMGVTVAPGGQREAEALGNGREQQRGFHQGERVADAEARAAAEREVRIAR